MRIRNTGRNEVYFCKVLLNKDLMVQVRYMEGFLKFFLGTRPHPRPNPVWTVGEGARNTAVCLLPVSATLSVDAAWCLPASLILPAAAVCLPMSSARFVVEVSLLVSSNLRAVLVRLPAS